MKKIIILILIGISFLSFKSKRENYSIWGRIVDDKFSPIDSFSIKVFEYNSNKEQKKPIQDFQVKDNNGEFLIKDLTPDTYLINITVENYTRYSIIKTVKDKNESVGEIFLQNSW